MMLLSPLPPSAECGCTAFSETIEIHLLQLPSVLNKCVKWLSKKALSSDCWPSSRQMIKSHQSYHYPCSGYNFAFPSAEILNANVCHKKLQFGWVHTLRVNAVLWLITQAIVDMRKAGWVFREHIAGMIVENNLPGGLAERCTFETTRAPGKRPGSLSITK